jgi:hypothetical protein
MARIVHCRRAGQAAVSFNAFGLLIGPSQLWLVLIIGGIAETQEMLDFCGET